MKNNASYETRMTTRTQHFNNFSEPGMECQPQTRFILHSVSVGNASAKSTLIVRVVLYHLFLQERIEENLVCSGVGWYWKEKCIYEREFRIHRSIELQRNGSFSVKATYQYSSVQCQKGSRATVRPMQFWKQVVIFPSPMTTMHIYAD